MAGFGVGGSAIDTRSAGVAVRTEARTEYAIEHLSLEQNFSEHLFWTYVHSLI